MLTSPSHVYVDVSGTLSTWQVYGTHLHNYYNSTMTTVILAGKLTFETYSKDSKDVSYLGFPHMDMDK